RCSRHPRHLERAAVRRDLAAPSESCAFARVWERPLRVYVGSVGPLKWSALARGESAELPRHVRGHVFCLALFAAFAGAFRWDRSAGLTPGACRVSPWRGRSGGLCICRGGGVPPTNPSTTAGS